MPRNIELKARLAAIEPARHTAQQLATQQLGTEHQIDTYYAAPHGRLKLRQISDQRAELIAYVRPDGLEARGSDYQLAPLIDPATLHQVLAAALGVRLVVEKQREIYLYHNVRIHLDQVVGLGSFLEFEAVTGDTVDDATAHAQVAWLAQQFALAPTDRVETSYSDLLSSP